MKNFFQFIFLILVITTLSLQSCNNQPAKVEDKDKDRDSIVKKEEPKIEIDRKYNDVARILAGLELDSSSQYYKVTQTPSWVAYKKQADAGWAAADERRFKAMREWASKELAEVNKIDGDLFYPFSGPDIYYSYQFFPSANNFHLFAMEQAGNLRFMKTDDVKWESYCNHVAMTIDDFIAGGFFHTNHMRSDMREKGNLPTLLVFLVRAGNTIAKVEHIEIKEDGSVGVTEKDSSSVRIDFIDSKTKKLKSLYYHSCNLSDAGFNQSPALKKRIEQVAINRTFTKSASYLMHTPGFLQIRDIILSKATSVFQDDTAIPFKYYAADKWNRTLYGKYNGPIKLFQTRIEKDLLDAYKGTDIKPLPFSLGYHSYSNQDNMILYTRK
jgi:hypothetical protein